MRFLKTFQNKSIIAIFGISSLQSIPEKLTLDALLEMNESKVKDTMKRCGASAEECSRLNGALACLRKVTRAGKNLERQAEAGFNVTGIQLSIARVKQESPDILEATSVHAPKSEKKKGSF